MIIRPEEGPVHVHSHRRQQPVDEPPGTPPVPSSGPVKLASTHPLAPLSCSPTTVTKSLAN